MLNQFRFLIRWIFLHTILLTQLPSAGEITKLEILFSSKMYKRAAFALILIILFTSILAQPASAQESGPIYIVQAGDTLSFIASRFNVSLNELVAANPSIDPNLLSQGQQVVIPGLEGVTGILETEVISFCDTLRSLSRRRQVDDAQLIKLNRRF